MTCKNCSINPVIKLPNSNIQLCKSCFIRYFEKKTLKTIRTYNLIEDNDKIALALSGGKDSLSLLYLLNKVQEKKRNIEVIAIAIDEGIKGYRDLTLKDAKDFCTKKNIPLKIYSYKKEFGLTLDDMTKKLNSSPCSICGVLRRYLLNKKARKLRVDKLATAHNLDDESQSILMNQIRNDLAVSARLGPITGIIKDPRFIPRIKPFYFLTEKEVATYAFLKDLLTNFVECPNAENSYRIETRDLLNALEQKHPGAKYGIVSSFIEILPSLKELYKDKEISSCKKCKEPCSSEICKTCQILEKLKAK